MRPEFFGSYGASNKTLTWLGAMRQPGQLVEFCNDMLVILVAGMPPMSTVNDPVKCRAGPITMPEATSFVPGDAQRTTMLSPALSYP